MRASASAFQEVPDQPELRRDHAHRHQPAAKRLMRAKAELKRLDQRAPTRQGSGGAAEAASS